MRALARCTVPLSSLVTMSIITNVETRFVSIPVSGLQDKLESQTKEMATDVESLSKRLHYLETTAKNSQEHIEKMLRGAGQS